MMSDSTILACHQRASGSKTVERRVSTVILNLYQSTGIEKEDGSRLSLESHRKLDEVLTVTWPRQSSTRESVRKENISTCRE